MENLIDDLTKKKLKQTLEETGNTYKNVFRYYYPAHGVNGFTERNLTFNFSHNYIKNNYDAIVWQELPVKYEAKEGGIVKEKDGHIDTLIIDNELKIILFVEAKRISKSQISSEYRSIKKDMKRLCATNFISSIPKGLLIDKYQHYILYLVDTWHDDSEEKSDPRKGVVTHWVADESKLKDWIPENSAIDEIDCDICQIGKPSSYKQTNMIYEKDNQGKYNLMYRLYSLPKQDSK